MLNNYDLYARDPRTHVLPNNGVSKVGEPQTDQEWEVLRYELQTFVCEGEYHKGIERILSTFLARLGEPEQPAVWVSGFYGSGKSHMVRVLEYLWNDITFPDGARARSLVQLPEDVRAHLAELDIAGKRSGGGLWSAAGTLSGSANDRVRLGLLAIVFRAAGLPVQYPAARFALWLKQNGYYDAVKAGVEAAGKTLASELPQMYVSPVLAKALLAACPRFATTDMEARKILTAQYPHVTDISNDELVAAMGEVFSLVSKTPGKVPCTLIVLDELQQFIDQSVDRMMQVQEVVQVCSSRFGSQLLFLATGQSGLLATTHLQRLQGRFTVRIELSSTDVEKVVRSVVLRKKPTQESALQHELDLVSGEIFRHLTGTKIGPEPADRAVQSADYPLLPTRRRFWERVLRAVDRGGIAGQLRTQLRVVHEAARETAEASVGTVVPGDFLYWQLALDLRTSGALGRELYETIQVLSEGSISDKLKARLCALIFLISQLPRDAAVDSGVRATADTLTDLLVTDLKGSSAALRSQVPVLLQELVDDGKLMPIDSEFHLQTREGAEWERDYRSRLAKLLSDDARIAADRSAALREAVTSTLNRLSFVQGESKTPRKVELHFGETAPALDTGNIPVWVRDEWAIAEKTVREDAHNAGTDGAMVYVFLPRRGADELKKALAGKLAAMETIQAHPTTTTREGEDAKAAMQSRRSEQERQLATLVATILKEARVFQGGGNEVAESEFFASVEVAAKAAMARLYPQFTLGDSAKWDTVSKRVLSGSGDALTVVGHVGEADKHPVCKTVLGFVGTIGKKGVEVRKRFQAPPYGWPQDAIDAALLVLVQSNLLSATLNSDAVGVAQLGKPDIGKADFRREGATVTAIQRIEVRKLLQAAGINASANEEAVALPQLVGKLRALAQTAGGAAPLPLTPDTTLLDTLAVRSGNELVLAVYDERDSLKRHLADWQAATEAAKARLPRWSTLERLLMFAEPLPIAVALKPQVAAIRTSRSLLSDPDPVPPLCAQLADALRIAVNTARDAHVDRYTEQIADLEKVDSWQKLTEAERQQIREQFSLGTVPTVALGTEDELLTTLNRYRLDHWENQTAALTERVKQALLEATRRLTPQAVRVSMPTATLSTEEEVDAYLAEVRTKLLAEIAAGKPVVF
jgi:hypothetical protein